MRIRREARRNLAGGLRAGDGAGAGQVMVRGKARLLSRLGSLSPERLADIEAGVLTALGL